MSQNYEALVKAISDCQDDVQKAEAGNKAATSRVRKSMQEVKALAQELRKEMHPLREERCVERELRVHDGLREARVHRATFAKAPGLHVHEYMPAEAQTVRGDARGAGVDLVRCAEDGDRRLPGPREGCGALERAVDDGETAAHVLEAFAVGHQQDPLTLIEIDAVAATLGEGSPALDGLARLLPET